MGYNIFLYFRLVHAVAILFWRDSFDELGTFQFELVIIRTELFSTFNPSAFKIILSGNVETNPGDEIVNNSSSTL